MQIDQIRQHLNRRKSNFTCNISGYISLAKVFKQSVDLTYLTAA